jgi:hypothetical protein
MANFGGTILTQKGINLITKALTGATIEFTRIQFGDGVWDESINPEQLTALVSPKLSLPIQGLEIVGDGTARLRFVLTNIGLAEGFFTREIGIFANDPDEGEILYAVAYAENADFIPADGGATKIESITDVYTVVSNAQNVTAVISDSVLLATLQDIEKHNTSSDAHQDIRKLINDIASSNDTSISQLQQELSDHESEPTAHQIPQQIETGINEHNEDLQAHPLIQEKLKTLRLLNHFGGI